MKNQIIAAVVAGLILLAIREVAFADRTPKPQGVMV